MVNELILWAALAVLIALMALAVWAGRRGLHALGVVGPGQGDKPGANSPDPQMAELIVELRRLNASLEKMVADGQIPDIEAGGTTKQPPTPEKAVDDE